MMLCVQVRMANGEWMCGGAEIEGGDVFVR